MIPRHFPITYITFFFIFACNEPKGHASMSFWRLPHKLDSPLSSLSQASPEQICVLAYPGDVTRTGNSCPVRWRGPEDIQAYRRGPHCPLPGKCLLAQARQPSAGCITPKEADHTGFPPICLLLFHVLIDFSVLLTPKIPLIFR